MSDYQDEETFRYDDPTHHSDEDFVRAKPASPVPSSHSSGTNTSRSARKARPSPAPVVASDDGSSDSDDDRTLEKELWDDEEAIGDTSIPKASKRDWVMRAIGKGQTPTTVSVPPPLGRKAEGPSLRHELT